MPVQFLCPHCRRKLSVGTRKIGSQVQCPLCQQTLTVPSAEAGLPEPPPLPDDGPLVTDPVPVGSSGTFVSQDDSGVTPVQSVRKPPQPGKKPGSDMLLISRQTLYIQAALISIVALLAFITGLLVGSARPGASPQQSQEVPISDEPGTSNF